SWDSPEVVSSSAIVGRQNPDSSSSPVAAPSSQADPIPHSPVGNAAPTDASPAAVEHEQRNGVPSRDPAAALLEALLAGAGLQELPRGGKSDGQAQRYRDEDVMRRVGS